MVQALCNVGCVLRQQGDLVAAINAFEAAFQAAPTLEVISDQLAAALTDRGTQLKAQGQVGVAGCLVKDHPHCG